MQLHFRKMGEGSPLIILHGLLGSMNNWQTLGMRLAQKFCVYLVDQRNHGRSPHSPEHDYPVMAQDLLEFLEHEQLPPAHLLGHSMGGKVAMLAATLHPDRFRSLTVIDIAPRAYTDGHRQLLEAMRDLQPGSCATREEAEEKLRARIPDQAVRQFILTNLKREESGQLGWRVNLTALLDQQDRMLEPITIPTPVMLPALFLRGASSSYIIPADEALITRLFPHAVIQTIAGAGHWVHADQPRLLEEALLRFLHE